MDPNVRSAILFGGLAFCVIFGAMTITVAAESSFDIFTVVSLLIIGMIAAGVIGAIRNPPDE